MAIVETDAGFEYSDETGEGVTWADEYISNLEKITDRFLNRKLFNIARSDYEAPRAQEVYIQSVEDNGSGKARFVSIWHTLIDGDIIVISGTTDYDGTALVVASATTNKFQLESAPDFTQSRTGYARCADNVYRADNQHDGIHGFVKSRFMINRPATNGEVVIDDGIELVVGMNGSISEYESTARQYMDCVSVHIGSSAVRIYALTAALAGNLVFNTGNANITPGYLFRIDYVEKES